jgi:putative ABC transport system ATP-binding protein
MGIFERIHNGGNTIIVVTHEPDIADHAHRIIKLRDGLVEANYMNDKIIRVDDPNHRYKVKGV